MAENTLSDDGPDRGQFSVAVFYDDGTRDYIVRFVNAEQAFIAFRNCVAVAEHPRAKHPPLRIIVGELRFRLMVKRGPCEQPQASEGEAGGDAGCRSAHGVSAGQ